MGRSIAKMRLWSILRVGAMLAFLSSMAWGAEFTADVVIDQDGKVYRGVAFIKDTNVRYELTAEAGEEVIIYRGDFGAQWTIFPKEEVYVELWNYFSEDFIVPELTRRLSEIATEEPLGSETVGGLECDVSLFRFHDPAQGTITVYRARELDYPIKIKAENKYSRLTKEYQNIKKDSLKDSLFELPKGLSMLK